MKKISAVTENIVTFLGHNQHLYEERQIRFLKWGIPVPTNSARLFMRESNRNLDIPPPGHTWGICLFGI